jgi:hypothetical protein
MTHIEDQMKDECEKNLMVVQEIFEDEQQAKKYVKNC